jgi:hypothetical protein
MNTSYGDTDLDPQAKPWIPSFVLRAPKAPMPRTVQEQKAPTPRTVQAPKPITTMDRLQQILTSCQSYSILFPPGTTFDKIMRYLTYHPDYSKRADEAFLRTQHPAIRVCFNDPEYIDFVYVEGSVWAQCEVGFRAPMGANLFHWDIHQPQDVSDGIIRLVRNCYPDILGRGF